MIYPPDRKITDILKEGFTLSAEVIPPRNGTLQQEVLDQIAQLTQAGAQFLAVTKGAGGSLRGGSLPIAQLIKERYLTPCVAHFTCRDLSPQDVENQMIDHNYFGIRNILALRGDPPQGMTDWKPAANSYSYAYQLIEQIRHLNEGQYLARPGYKVEKSQATDFVIGCAAYPDHPDATERMGFFQRKIESGAHFAITQMLFSVPSFERFLKECRLSHVQSVPTLPGTRILSSKKAAKKITQRFEVPIDQEYFDSLPDEPEVGNAKALQAFNKFCVKLKNAGAPGLHIFVLNDAALAAEAIYRLRN